MHAPALPKRSVGDCLGIALDRYSSPRESTSAHIDGCLSSSADNPAWTSYQGAGTWSQGPCTTPSTPAHPAWGLGRSSTCGRGRRQLSIPDMSCQARRGRCTSSCSASTDAWVNCDGDGVRRVANHRKRNPTEG